MSGLLSGTLRAYFDRFFKTDSSDYAHLLPITNFFCYILDSLNDNFRFIILYKVPALIRDNLLSLRRKSDKILLIDLMNSYSLCSYKPKGWLLARRDDDERDIGDQQVDGLIIQSPSVVLDD